MASRRTVKSSNGQRFLIASLVVVGVIAIIFGVIQLGSPSGNTVAEKSREGLVPVPKTLVAVRAFDKVKREDIFDLSLGDDSYFWLPKAQVDAHPEWVKSVDQVIGRVMARDKSTDFVFKESDFLPEGSRTGLIGGVPIGKQGFFLDADKIPGLRFLKKGDRFDLLINLPEESRDSSAEYGLLMGGIKVRDGKPIPVNGIRLLAQNAEVIALTTNKSMTTRGGLSFEPKDANGRELRSDKQERVLIAISPQESVPLTEALGSEFQIHMVIQSGQLKFAEKVEDGLNGLIPFTASATHIDAFSKITAADLAEPASGELRRYYFKPSDVNDSWIPKAEDLIGKIVAREIEPGYIFSPSDFLNPDHLVQDVEAYQTLTAADLVGGESSEWLGKVASKALKAGVKLDDEKILTAGTLIQNVKAYEMIRAESLVEGRNSVWLGKRASTDLNAGDRLMENLILSSNSLATDVEAFQELTANDLAGGSSSPWLGRIISRPGKAGQSIDEKILLKKGARSGIAGAIPPNKLALTIPVKSVNGLSRLSFGDRVDLIESKDLDLVKLMSGISVSPRVLASFKDSLVNQVIATEVLIVDTDGEQVVVAVDVSEVSPITKALANEQNEITAITRAESSNNDPPNKTANQGDETPIKAESVQISSDSNPLDSIIVSQLIVDGKKTKMAFRRTSIE